MVMTKAEQEWSLIEALEYCKKKRPFNKSCAGCPYAGVGCAIDAVIAKLKAQEPVEPKMMEFVDEGLTWEKYEVPTCGVCGALLGDALFCPMCGRAVKWE